MTTIAELGIRVESGDAVSAATDLDRLVDAGGRAEKAAAGVEQSARKAGQALKEQAGDVSALLGEIDPTLKALGKLDDLEKRLSQQRKLGNLDPSTFSEYRSKIQQSRDDLSRFDEALGRTGVSAKQTAAAMRMLPAQFSDIFVSLQGGQAPLTVFLQQGSQIKDSFGGIGAATKAMGGYLLELVNPATVSAAAIAGLGYAFYDAQREMGAFSRAIFAGVNRSGQTVESLNQIATTVGRVTGSFGGARDAVISLSSGLAGSSIQIQNLATAAVAISEITGKGVEEVATALEKSGKNATDSAAKISEQYGLLTFEQYEVIKALDDQGEHQRALDVLSEKLNTAAQERLKKYRESLSDIERDWNSIKKAISNAYAEVKAEVAPNEAQQADIARRILERRQEGGFLGALSNLFSFGDNTNQALRTVVLNSEEKAEATERETQAQTDLNNANRDLIRISRELDSQLDNVSPANKRADAYKKLNEQFFELMSASARSGKESPLLAGVEYDGKKFSGGAYDSLAAGIEKRLKDKPSPKTPAYREDAGTKALDQARQQYSVLQQQNGLIGAQVGEMQKLGEAGQALVKWEQQLADIKDKKVLTADQKSLLANQQQITAQLKKNAELEKEMQLRKVATEDAQKLAAFQANLNSQLQRSSLGLSNSLAGSGLGDQARQRIEERFSIEQQYQQQMDNLLEQRNAGKLDSDLYEKQNEALRQALDQRLAMQEQYYLQVDQQQSDWSLGARAAFSTYLEQAQNVAGQTRSLFTNAFSNMEDAVVTFVKTGKLSFRDFADQVVADLIRIQVRQAAAGFLNTAINAGMSMYGGGANGFAAGSAGATSSTLGASAAGYSSQYGFSDGGYTGDGGKLEPKGVVHGGEFVLRKEVVAQPGMRNYLEGLNVRGYASGGFVTPLPTPRQITSTGEGGQVAPVTVSIAISGDGTSQAQANTPGMEQFGKEIGAFVEAKYRKLLSMDLRPDGAIGRTMQRR